MASVADPSSSSSAFSLPSTPEWPDSLDPPDSVPFDEDVILRNLLIFYWSKRELFYVTYVKFYVLNIELLPHSILLYQNYDGKLQHTKIRWFFRIMWFVELFFVTLYCCKDESVYNFGTSYMKKVKEKYFNILNISLGLTTQIRNSLWNQEP